MPKNQGDTGARQGLRLWAVMGLSPQSRLKIGVFIFGISLLQKYRDKKAIFKIPIG
jgi:hypothetical protein